MAVRVIRDERVYHSPTSQFHDLVAGQVIEGDFANYLEANAPSVVEPAGSGDVLGGADGDPSSVAEGSTDPLAPSGIGTNPVVTSDALLSPLSLENSLQRQGAAYFSPDTSLPPGTPDPVQLAMDGRSAMAVSVPITVTTDSAVGQIPGAGNQNRARTQVEGRPPSGSNIVSENGSDEGAGVVVVPQEAYRAVLVEPVTGATVSQSAPPVEGGFTSATEVVEGGASDETDEEEPAPGGVDPSATAAEGSAGVEIEGPAAPAESDESAPRSEPNADPDPKLGEQDAAGDSADDPAAPFDPSDHKATDVIAYADAHPDEKPAILQAEREGKARTTVLNALS